MSLRRQPPALLTPLLLLLFAAACGTADDSSTSVAGGTASVPATSTPRPTAPSEPVPSGSIPPVTAADLDGRAFVATAAVTVGAGTMEIEPLATTRMACAGEAGEVERDVLTVLDGTVQFTIEADQLTLTNGDAGLIYRAGA
jgi:heat shock protein HslJ